jgi:hypothetical protein
VAVRADAVGVFPVFVVLLVSAPAAIAPATAPTAPAATALPVSWFLGADGVVAGVDGGAAGVAVPARDSGNFLVGFGPLGVVPLGMGKRMGLGSIGGLVGCLLPVPALVTTGVLGNVVGMDCPCAGGNASQSSSSSIFGPRPAS